MLKIYLSICRSTMQVTQVWRKPRRQKTRDSDGNNLQNQNRTDVYFGCKENICSVRCSSELSTRPNTLPTSKVFSRPLGSIDCNWVTGIWLTSCPTLFRVIYNDSTSPASFFWISSYKVNTASHTASHISVSGPNRRVPDSLSALIIYVLIR